MLLYWSLLKYSTDHGFTQFDFGRSSIGEGTYRFKQQWGARPVPLDWKYFQNNTDSDTNKARNKKLNKSLIRRFLEIVWCKMPLQVANLLGSKIRKYISL